MTDPELAPISQTEFNEVSPILSGYNTPIEPKSPQEEEKSKDKVPKGILVGGVAFTLILILVGVLALMTPQVQKQMAITPVASPTAVPIQDDELVTKIKALTAELQAADPTQNKLAFPPVDMEIYLDQPKR